MAKQLSDFLAGIENAEEVERLIKENMKNEKCKLFIDDGKDNIYVPKGRLDAKIGELSTANETINTLNTTIKTLKAQAGDEDAQKKIQDLQDELGKYDTKVKDIQINNALELLALENKAKDTKDLRAFVDITKVTVGTNGEVVGLKEQVENLKKEKGYLFDVEENPDNQQQQKKFPSFFGPNPGKPDNTNLFKSKTVQAGDFGKLLAGESKEGKSENVIDADYFFNKK